MQEGSSWVANLGVKCFNDFAKAMLSGGMSRSHTQSCLLALEVKQRGGGGAFRRCPPLCLTGFSTHKGQDDSCLLTEAYCESCRHSQVSDML